jgi:hypothetical protein
MGYKLKRNENTFLFTLTGAKYKDPFAFQELDDLIYFFILNFLSRFSQTMKRIPTGKAIPLPKIGSTFDNTKPLNNSTPAMHNNTQQLPPPPASVLQNHLQHPAPPMTMMTNAQTDLTLQQQQHQQPQQPTTHNHTSNTNNIHTNNNPNNTIMTTTNTSNSMSPPPPPLNDSEFYAVTEL